MPYTHIARNYARAGGAGTQATIPHTVGVATEYCCFLIQDTTVGGGAQALPRMYVPDADKGAAQILVTDDTVVGALRMDALIVAPHSLIDVGPVWNGVTRGNNPAGIYSFGTSGIAYRSLHRNVPITIANGQPTGTVAITHRLGTDNVVCFVSPSSSPTVTSSAGGAGRIFQVYQTNSAAGVVTLTAMVDDGGNNAAGPTTVTYDVMVLARAAVGLVNVATWPYAMVTPRATAGANIGLPSDDYSGADLARCNAPMFSTTVGGYVALYTNVDLGLGNTSVGHAFGTSTDVIGLVGFSATAPGSAIPTIGNNAIGVNDLRFTMITAGCNDCYVLILRPYSIFQPTCTTV